MTISQNIAERVRDLAQEHDITTMARMLGVHHSQVRDALKLVGICPPRGGRPEFDWTDATVEKLTEMWADHAVPVKAIGEHFGVSTSAVCGKAHRLKLPPRASPIKRDRPQRRRQKRAPKVTISGVAKPETAPPPPATVRPHARVRECCWPMWGNRQPTPKPPLFCGEAVAEGSRDYCAKHFKLAHPKPRPMEGRNAA